jgi:hydroxyacylglutathione hydrolase
MANELNIEPIAAFDDNYIWLLSTPGYSGCAVVDPGDDEPVREVLQQRGLHLDAILVTHKHGDHVGGIRGLKQTWPQAVVYGPANEPIKTLEKRLVQGDTVVLDGLAEFQTIDVPGHTEGHIAYYMPGVLFCGDTLFAGGCGRVFSGTFEQLSESLLRIAELPPDTKIYCAHEYTQDNLGFAQWVEPDNPNLLARIGQVKQQRLQGLATVPSLLSEELATNPFMRTTQNSVIAAAEKWVGQKLGSPAAVFKAVRIWKDTEYD